MEMGEAIGVGLQGIDNGDRAPKCTEKDNAANKGWTARVNGLGKDGTPCSGEKLYKSMDSRRDEHANQKGLGVVPLKLGDEHWATKGIEAVTPESFPVQAHHLIPKNFLPGHDVCVWLCQKAGNDEYELIEDSFYNTDHANNGYAMPYAVKLKEWKAAKDADEKCKVAFKVMKKTGLQLHQGSHARSVNMAAVNELLPAEQRVPVEPAEPGSDSDDFSQSGIHQPGYLDPIEQWLNAIAARVEGHVVNCSDGCRVGTSGDKLKVRPMAETVKLMNQVSYITKAFLQMNAIYACPYGAAFAISRGDLVWDKQARRFRVADWE